MRIAVNCCLFRDHSGGVRQYFSRVMNRLLRNADDEYVLLFGPQSERSLNEMLLPQWRACAIEVGSAAQVRRLIAGFDLYFCPSGWLWPRPLHIPSVITLVDIQEAYFPEFFSFRERWSRFYHHAASTRDATRVITISEFSRQGIAACHHIPAAKIDIAYPAADQNERAEAGVPAGLPERFLLYPANFWPHKNHDRLFHALALARERHGVMLHCVLTGERVPHGYEPAGGIQRYRLENQVHLLDYQPSAVLAALYRRATALVFPSLFEGFGLPLVEAMVAGCPIACSRTSSLPEVAGDDAVYFSPQDPAAIAAALVAVWSDAALRSHLAISGRARAARFSLDAAVAAHQRTFERARREFGMNRSISASVLCDLITSAWMSVRGPVLPRPF